MIERILIKQFAIIDHLEIDFQSAFSVLSGETGAGKSIIIEAISILLGDRSAVEMIRHGAQKAYIEGVFSFAPAHPVYLALAEGGWAEEGEQSFTLSRELNVNGKNPCRINGCTVGFGVYRQFASALLDIHGQHEYQQLMQTQRQIDILDAYGGEGLQATKGEVREAFGQWHALEDKLAQAKEGRETFAAKKSFLVYQLEEIDEARIQPGEELELEADIRRLSHSQRILKNLGQAFDYLFQYHDGEAAYDLLAKALRQLKELGKYDPALEELHDRLEPASYLMDEASREIERYRDQMEVSPARLEETENRLYKIKALGKKYGEGTEAILRHRESAAAELADMEIFESKEEEWERQAEEAKALYYRRASALSLMRGEIKKALEARIDQEFGDLAMGAAHFLVDMQDSPPGTHGTDRIEFLISTNVGEPYLPLAKIASGGELSRITLAMKKILAESDTCESLVFDEIDSGIGGTTIHAVAEKLADISRSQQVICVTHSPVIAARAGQHLLLEKAEQDGRTSTDVRELKAEERVEELARMLGGDAESADLRRHARVMLGLEA